MTTNELREMIITNFILHYSSDDKERDEMIECAIYYCRETDVEFDSTISIED